MICKWGRHFDVVRLNLQLNSLQQAHLQNDQIDQITKQGLALPCALNTIFSHISQCIIICLRMSVLKPGTTATLSGFHNTFRSVPTTVSCKFQNEQSRKPISCSRSAAFSPTSTNFMPSSCHSFGSSCWISFPASAIYVILSY